MDMRNLIKKYSGQWVALDVSMEKIIANGKDIKKVFTEAGSKYKKTPFLFKVPTELIGYIGESVKV